MKKVFCSNGTISEQEDKLECDIWDVPDVSRYLHVCEKTVWTLIKKNKIKSFKVGARVKIRKRDVEEYIRHQLGIAELKT